MDQVLPGIQSQFARAGRGGSGLGREAEAKAGSDIFARMYQQERQNQMGAGAQLAGLSQQNQNRQLGASQFLGGMYGQDRARALAATGQAAGLGAGAAGQLGGMYGDERGRQMMAMGYAPSMENLAYSPANRLGQIGAQYEGKGAEQMQDDWSRWEQSIRQPERQLDQYLQRIQGISPSMGMGQTTTSPYFQNQGAGMLGGAMAGLGLAQGMGEMFPSLATAGFNPWLGAGMMGMGLLSQM
jgi:hypothetical protein